ncbi:MAG: GNAT family N-acetyltransferase [Thermoplasmata archaeon]|uniref:GNAT family N-acetyltransferase n=1 Tax=Candidatus Sysuiplasma superficiale TaxID=2823368 RepID=A0A8J7YMX0_9ARCH|nr:GNAT family N-acetyltransferase [Candidatus Sysuiplasma superficiale]MBX8643723.1 GNAT family N-acetyltransferase [Candidatus Sysuiplasma superficiale]MCL5437500.1 GNAT family N-acetyltransferase [Candidatus Thermoplasmatota archaeon]
MIVVREADPETQDLKGFFQLFGEGVTASGEELPPGWVEERIDSIRNKQEYCYVAMEADETKGVIVFSQKGGRGFAFVSWRKDGIDREGLLLLVREYVNRMNSVSWMRISGIHPNVPDEVMTSVCESLGFQRRCRMEMSRALSDIPEFPPPEGRFGFIPITDFSEGTLSKLDFEGYRGTPDEGLFADSVAEYEGMMHSLLTGDYGPVIKDASVCAVVEGNPVAMIAVTDMGENAFVADLVISEPYRRKGIARYLLSNAMKSAAQLKKKEITLWVSEENSSALSLYKSVGFTEVRKGAYYARRLREPVR